jgi:hypothetical protein
MPPEPEEDDEAPTNLNFLAEILALLGLCAMLEEGIPENAGLN